MLLAVLLLIGKSLGMERQSLQEVQDRTLCPFRYHQDVDQHRLPVVIEKVECLKNLPRLGQITYVDDNQRFNRTCTCTEVYTHLAVEYRRGKIARNDTVVYPVGCMCLNDSSQKSKEHLVHKVA